MPLVHDVEADDEFKTEAARIEIVRTTGDRITDAMLKMVKFDIAAPAWKPWTVPITNSGRLARWHGLRTILRTPQTAEAASAIAGAPSTAWWLSCARRGRASTPTRRGRRVPRTSSKRWSPRATKGSQVMFTNGLGAALVAAMLLAPTAIAGIWI